MGLREQIAKDAEFMIHRSGWQQEIIFMTADGVKHETTAQVIYPAKVEDMQSGQDIVFKKLSVSISRRAVDFTLPDSLTCEGCLVKIPLRPIANSEMKWYAIARPREGGQSFDFVTYFLRDLDDEPLPVED